MKGIDHDIRHVIRTSFFQIFDRQQSPSLDRNFCNPFTEIHERLPVQPIQSDTQN